ncbi:MAG: ATP-binding protein [Thiobacillaceae bacterium]|jgi:hypothetical protein|nr:ATP-binding protein [Thiobacillaceae bacterium]
MLPRNAAPTLLKLAGWYPVVVVTGPRQSGKTTLTRAVFPDKAYVSLEDPDLREFAAGDPRAFLRQHAEGAILDEAQRVPELLSYLQGTVDADPRPGRYILTGSQQLGLLSGVSQSLAGRAGMLTLLPFTLDELSAHKPPDTIETLLWSGLYPPVHDRGIPPDVWYRDYALTYVERDVRQLVNVRDLGQFQRFVRMCAARTGQLLNLSALAADCGITHNTARAWLSVLQASHLVTLLTPYHRNYGKRLTKTPKLYFLDSGLACHLLGIARPDTLITHSMRGALFETWVVGEYLKAAHNAGETPALWFWRDSAGHEVDLLAERDGGLRAIEIKAGMTIAADWFDGLERFRRLAPEAGRHLIYAGDTSQARTLASVTDWRHIADAIGRETAGTNPANKLTRPAG